MDMQAVTQLVGSVGFPIAMCFILVYYIKGEQDTMRQTLTELKLAIQSLTEEIKDLQRQQRGADYYDV